MCPLFTFVLGLLVCTRCVRVRRAGAKAGELEGSGEAGYFRGKILTWEYEKYWVAIWDPQFSVHANRFETDARPVRA